MTLKVRLPEYGYPRTAWRRSIYRVVLEQKKKTGTTYTKNDKIELSIKLYFGRSKIKRMDVDNRLKDIMDALQGRFGGTGSKCSSVAPIIPNDSQIYRVHVEKQLPPWKSHGLGHLRIRKYGGKRY